MKMLYLFAFIFIFNLSFALPRFSVQNGTSCIACHVNPTGSGLRNDYGSNVMALDELPLERWISKGNEDWDGYVGDHLQVGGDFRFQGIHYNDSDTTQKSAFFPMQADIYMFLKLNQNAGIYSKIGARGKSSLSTEFWALLNNLPQNAWIRFGRSLPNYGLRVDDHTSFIRGGNYSRTTLNLDKEGLLFGPYLNPPIIFEIGVPMFNGLQWTSSVGTGIIQNHDELTNLTTQFNYSESVNENFKYLVGFNFMQEDQLEMMGISGGLSFLNFTYTFEIDQAENLIDGSTSLALYDELVWGVIQGLQIIGKYDFFDPQTELLSGSISRYSLGVEIYPLNIMEIKLQIRINQIDLENIAKPDPEYLIQTHFWF